MAEETSNSGKKLSALAASLEDIDAWTRLCPELEIRAGRVWSKQDSKLDSTFPIEKYAFGEDEISNARNRILEDG